VLLFDPGHKEDIVVVVDVTRNMDLISRSKKFIVDKGTAAKSREQ